MFNAIRRRLLVWNTAVLVTLLVALGLAIYFITARTLYDEVNRTLRDNARETLANLSATPGFPFVLPRSGYSGDVFFLSLDLSGRVMENPQGLDVVSSPDPAGVQRALAGHEVFGTVDLNRHPVRVLSAPVFSGDGATLGLLQVGRSIQAERDALSRLALVLGLSEAAALVLALGGGWFLAERALVPIRRAFERQRRFVADASHELRTPLALIRSSGELLSRHGPQTIDENRKLVDGIVAETDYLSGVVSGLLTLAQSDAGRLVLELAPVELDELVRGVCDDVRPLAELKSVGLQCGVPAPEAVVEGDRSRLRQAVLAVLDNAVKYTPSGGQVRASVAVEGGEAHVEVADTGRGITPEHLPHVFDRFSRADDARGRDAGGAGLGLSIARALVEAHRGSISIESMLGRGTTVHLRLPLGKRMTRLAVPADVSDKATF